MNASAPASKSITDAVPAPIKRPEVVVYTDGACKGNPGRGGWGAWLRTGEHQKELFGGKP